MTRSLKPGRSLPVLALRLILLRRRIRVLDHARKEVVIPGSGRTGFWSGFRALALLASSRNLKEEVALGQPKISAS
jgi:hypothetical protein